MGKSTRKLTIVALPPCSEWPEMTELEKHGHVVTRLEIDADIIMGANCWRMTEKHKQYLSLALKEARMLRYQQHDERMDAKKRRDANADIGPIGDSVSDEELPTKDKG